MKHSVPSRLSMMAQTRQALLPWVALMTRRWPRFLVGALLVWLTLAAGLSLLGLSGWFITACALAGIAMLFGLPSSLDVYVPGGGIRFFALLRTVARYIERLYNHDTVLRLLADLRYRVFGRLTRMDEAALRRHRMSDWLGRLTADIDALDNLYLRLLMPPLVSLLVIVGVSLFAAIWLPGMALWLGSVLFVLWVGLTYGMARLCFAQSHRQIAYQEGLRRLVIDQLQATAELIAYQSAAWHRQQVADHENAALDNQRRLGRHTAMGNSVIGVITGLLLLLVFWFGGALVADGTLAGPILVMLLLIILGINEVFVQLPAAFARLGSSVAAAERLNALAVDTPAKEQKLPAHELDVVMRGVIHRYPSSAQPALDDVTFELGCGEQAVITGHSGAGKSTLAALLTGRLKASQGEVEIGGCEPWAIKETQRSRRIVLLTQQVDLFDASLEDNLRLGNAEASDASLWKVLEAVALDDWARTLPAQLKTPVGERGQQLSGGQARRVALARLLLMDPSIVILDEPFAAIDHATAEHVARALSDWLEGRTAIFFVHHGSRLLMQQVKHHWHLSGGKLGPGR
ncbi:ATP-binding cassette subfamily C protein CydC [Vreelandella songnenensis]|uniref:ATP-binding cassette subfamily C protein CydC n=1 Tax=Vreelandella songnenensis TaxID=1176243 RepID=A0A2T0V0Z8_9GAMM|nr:thiol reductant ABC exporter subunit CydC [Halomonas songnenensis]PRY63860.1 ATP-binding cassette subfamily C protein CydC [Halomonas songnenensis]